MRPVYYTLTAAGNSAVHVPDHYISPFNVALGCTATGTVNYSVQYTFDDTTAAGYNPATGNWVAVTTLNNLTASADAAIGQPVMGIRLVCNSTTGGSIRLAIIQAGGSGR